MKVKLLVSVVIDGSVWPKDSVVTVEDGEAKKLIEAKKGVSAETHASKDKEK